MYTFIKVYVCRESGYIIEVLLVVKLTFEGSLTLSSSQISLRVGGKEQYDVVDQLERACYSPLSASKDHLKFEHYASSQKLYALSNVFPSK